MRDNPYKDLPPLERRPDGSLYRMTPAQRKQAVSLIRRECCCCEDGNCIVLDDGDTCTCPQTVSFSVCCKWFRWAVLPLDGTLEAEIFRDKALKRCAVCGGVFVPKSNRAKYCPGCAARVHRRRNRDSIFLGWTLGRTLCRRPHSVLAPYPGKSLLPAFRFAARPTSGTTYSRPRKKPSADRCRCPHRQGQCSCRPHSNSTPGVSGWPPVSFAPMSCGKGNRPACVPGAASLYRGYLSCVPSILLSVAVLPEKVSCPIPAAYSGVGTLPATSGQLVPK